MAAIATINSSFLRLETISVSIRSKKGLSVGKRGSLRIQAAKFPAGLKMPKVEPKLTEPFLGFTNTAEIWNSRACMIGLIGTFIAELILHKGILQIIGVEVGKGLDIPL